MKFRIRQDKEKLYYVQAKSFLLWKTLKKDGEVIRVNSTVEAELLAKEYYVFIKNTKKTDEVVRSFSIN